jgi:hypothetical protein
MIEPDEDDEEILNKGISSKTLLKTIFVVLLVILGALFIYIGIFPDPVTNFMIGFTLICFGTTIIQLPKQPSEPIRQTLTILTCALCGITKVRNYEQGDFVFKKTEPCSQCNDSMQVKQIYSVKLKKPTESSKNQDNSAKISSEKK